MVPGRFPPPGPRSGSGLKNEKRQRIEETARIGALRGPRSRRQPRHITQGLPLIVPSTIWGRCGAVRSGFEKGHNGVVVKCFSDMK